MITPMPFLIDLTFTEYNTKYKVHVRHRINDILLVLSFAKLYIPIRFSLMASYFQSSRAQRVCFMNGHTATYLFSLKCLMKTIPYTFVLINLVGSILVFGYTLRIFDTDLNTVSKQNFNQIKNVYWLSIITMTTIGYGDVYPKSTPSRAIGVVLSFYGVYIMSLFVITLSNALAWEK